MNLPEPLAWVHKNDFGRLMFSSSPTVPPWSFPVYTEAQLREALASQAAEPVGYVRMLNGEPTPDDDGCVFSYGGNPYRDTYGDEEWVPVSVALPAKQAADAGFYGRVAARQSAELKQLQEQNTNLDNIASELQSTCDRQAVKLASHEAVMRQALNLLGPTAPECCGCEYEWNEAIKALEAALK